MISHDSQKIALEVTHGVHLTNDKKETIMRSSGLPWNWNLLSYRADLPIEFLIRHWKKMSSLDGLLSHPGLTPEVMHAHPEIPWK